MIERKAHFASLKSASEAKKVCRKTDSSSGRRTGQGAGRDPARRPGSLESILFPRLVSGPTRGATGPGATSSGSSVPCWASRSSSLAGRHNRRAPSRSTGPSGPSSPADPRYTILSVLTRTAVAAIGSALRRAGKTPRSTVSPVSGLASAPYAVAALPTVASGTAASSYPAGPGLTAIAAGPAVPANPALASGSGTSTAGSAVPAPTTGPAVLADRARAAAPTAPSSAATPAGG
jgi:hypothetical protein